MMKKAVKQSLLEPTAGVHRSPVARIAVLCGDWAARLTVFRRCLIVSCLSIWMQPVGPERAGSGRHEVSSIKEVSNDS